MKRTKHSLSHYHLTTMDMGKLVPIGCVEVIPGDTFQHATSALIRVSPLVAPVMHPVQVRIHHWYVPNRLVFPDWEKLITGSDESVEIPKLNSAPAKSIADYMGVPPQFVNSEYNALPIYAYNKIFNEFYRDQDLVDEVPEDNLNVLNVAWGKDYFTAARPWPQKGGDVTLPLGDRADVLGIGISSNSGNAGTLAYDIRQSDGSTVTRPGWPGYVDGSGANLLVGGDNGQGFPDIYADLSEATAATVNDVRKAFALQRYQEARARYGSRYTEYLRYLGVTPSDARLQRPEYLGGGRQSIAFSEVLQTGPGDDPVGTMRGHGISAMRSRSYRRFFEEHGYVISLMSVRPKSVYMNGVDRHWLKQTKEDYYQKELELIGQQEIYNNEIFAQLDATGQGYETFGWGDRYAEYRHERSHVSSEFRNTLDYWHMARKFDTAPALNQTFVDCVPTKRVHAEQTQDVLWCMINHSLTARRMVRKNAMSRII